MRFLSFILALFILVPSGAHSQNLYTLSGNVVDDNRKPVEVGEASLMRESDSALIKTVVITNGEFIMDTTRAGRYWLRITAVGFRHHLIKVTVDESKLIPIRLVAAPHGQKSFLSDNF